ncbi:putative organic anion transporter polypeptide, major facilitator superfamily [Helianthus anomalus]
MVGLLLASPIFASMAKSFNPFRLIAVGLSVWTLSAIGCGISIGFWTITVCRMLVGVGEASFISLAAPFIDENAPVTQRSAWLGIFYMCIPTGVALGYVYGGLVGGAYGWRYAFFGEAILMLPFVIMGFFMSPLQLKGYISYNFVIGAYSYWGPKAGYSIYHMTDADLLFGGITIVGGIVGTLTGGFVLDYMNSTIPNAFKLLSVATFFGAVFCFAAFCFKDMYMFIVFFLIGEILVFATQGPVNFVSIHSVDPSLKPLAMAMSTVSIHVFGDVPSSPLVGVMQDKLKNWRKSTLILTSVLFLAAGIWSIGVFIPSVDRYNDDNENPTAPSNENKAAKKTAVSPEP